jgi:hypothetical protein
VERVQELIDMLIQGHDFRVKVTTKDAQTQSSVQQRNYSQQTEVVVKKHLMV